MKHASRSVACLKTFASEAAGVAGKTRTSVNACGHRPLTFHPNVHGKGHKDTNTTGIARYSQTTLNGLRPLACSCNGCSKCRKPLAKELDVKFLPTVRWTTTVNHASHVHCGFDSMTTKHLISEDYMELCPAYGRDYTNRAAAKADFLAGKDFKGDYTVGFAYCSCRDFAPGTKVNVRYNKGLGICTVVV